MKEFMRKLAVTIMLASLALINCAATSTLPVSAKGLEKIIGTPSLVGMTKEEVLEAAGPPVETSECSLQISTMSGVETIAGESFAWNFNYQDSITGDVQMYLLYTCLLDGIAVAEERRWHIKDSGQQIKGRTEVIDKKLIQDVLRNMERDGPKLPTYNPQGLNI